MGDSGVKPVIVIEVTGVFAAVVKLIVIGTLSATGATGEVVDDAPVG